MVLFRGQPYKVLLTSPKISIIVCVQPIWRVWVYALLRRLGFSVGELGSGVVVGDLVRVVGIDPV